MKQKQNTNSSSSSSSSLQKIQKKWLDAAIQMGGLGSTIVLSKASAKPIIHNMMKDSFRPMNITSIYKVWYSNYLDFITSIHDSL